MKYVLIYDNPERNYIIGLSFNTWSEADKRLTECKARGMLESHFNLVLEDDPRAVWLKENQHMF